MVMLKQPVRGGSSYLTFAQKLLYENKEWAIIYSVRFSIFAIHTNLSQPTLYDLRQRHVLFALGGRALNNAIFVSVG